MILKQKPDQHEYFVWLLEVVGVVQSCQKGTQILLSNCNANWEFTNEVEFQAEDLILPTPSRQE